MDGGGERDNSLSLQYLLHRVLMRFAFFVDIPRIMQ